MEKIIINDVIEALIHDSSIYEIKVHPFSKNDMGLYEDGIRKALKGMDENDGIILFLDFGEDNIMRDLDDRALFDLFQFISFNCLRHKKVCIKWSPALLDYLVNYAPGKDMTWKMSSSTINKLISINYNS